MSIRNSHSIAPSTQIGSMASSGDSTMAPSEGESQEPSVERIKELLRTKNDTSRFVGLALLKTVLDNSAEVRDDKPTISELWASIPPKFLDRLMQTGSTSHKDAKDMLDLAVAVIHTFTMLLQDSVQNEKKLIEKIPALVEALRHCSDETTKLALQSLAVLVNALDDSGTAVTVQDLAPLIEIARSHPLSLGVIASFLINATIFARGEAETAALRKHINNIVDDLVSYFEGTDGVTFLAFFDRLFRNIDSSFVPSAPLWISSIIAFVHGLVTSRPTAVAREIYTNAAATLLQTHRLSAEPILFAPDGTEKPASYLLIRLILIDLRSTIPTLLSLLNSPSYTQTATRLASALDILSSFIGYLVRTMDDTDGVTPILPPSLLLTLRKDISETFSLVIEHLRDRYDASTAGALGLHPDARTGATAGSQAQHPPMLAWDSGTSLLESDPLALAAVRALALWLREDENGALRREAGGLMDLFVELYRSSSAGDDSTTAASLQHQDFRRPLLVAFEGMLAEEDCKAALLEHGGWAILTDDLGNILVKRQTAPNTAAGAPSAYSNPINTDSSDALSRGLDIVGILETLAEDEVPTPDAWMDIVARVGATAGSANSQTEVEFETAALEIAGTLLRNAHPATRRRPERAGDAGAVVAAGRKLLRRKLVGDISGLREIVEDVVESIGKLR